MRQACLWTELFSVKTPSNRLNLICLGHRGFHRWRECWNVGAKTLIATTCIRMPWMDGLFVSAPIRVVLALVVRQAASFTCWSAHAGMDRVLSADYVDCLPFGRECGSRSCP